MDIVFGTWMVLLGLAVGSFLNVVILRFNTGRDVGGRSSCGTCGYTLHWYDLVPIFSFIGLRGRCRKCRSPLSLQYPLVEMATGLLFLGAYLTSHSYGELLYLAVVLSLLVVIFVYDLRHKIIPDEFAYSFAALSLVPVFYDLTLGTFVWPNPLALLAGPLLFVPFFALWFYSRGTWMGLGDGKLAVGIGWFLGLKLGFSAIVLGFWIGAVFGICLVLYNRYGARFREQLQLLPRASAVTMESEIPFAPFLIIGFLLVLFWGIDVFELFSFY